MVQPATFYVPQERQGEEGMVWAGCVIFQLLPDMNLGEPGLHRCKAEYPSEMVHARKGP
jgi:hypothetical protein